MSAPPPSWHTEHLSRLVAGMQQGDAAAADELFRRVRIRLECLARRMLRRFPVVRCQADTDDVLQEASLRLLNALRVVTPEDTQHFFALASEHIRFHLLDLARRFRRGAHQPLHEHPEPIAPGTGPDAAVEELEFWQALNEAARQLPDEEREVFGLRYYQGWSWPEIAERLQVNERTARRRWDRALIALREALGGWTPPDEDEPEPPEQQTS